MKCPRCGFKSVLSNALSLWCSNCDWEVVDPQPLADTVEERRRQEKRGKR